MSALPSTVRPKARLLASLVLFGMLAFPASARAQWFQWSNGGSFATFGPNSSVTMDLGQFVAGNCDPFFPATNVFVVNLASIGDGAQLVDVSNADGLPNTIIGASGGLFVSETIAFTAPGGFLGPGTYGIVFDECQDGHFNAGVDTLFYPAFEVVIPADVPILPSAAIAEIKAQAKVEGNSWARLVKQVEAIELLIEMKGWIECLQGGIAGCAVSYAIDQAEAYVKSVLMGLFGLVDPKDAAKDAVLDTIAHYGGIAADPPDPSFRQLSPLGLISPIDPQSVDPLVQRLVGLGSAERNESALLAALLHSVERYQGADAANDGDWALIHARAIQAYSSALAAQLPSTNAALSALSAALAADTRDFDGASTALGPVRARIEATGFDALETLALTNLGFSPAAIANIRAVIIGQPSTSFTKAGMQSDISDALAANADLALALGTLVSDMDGVIATLLADPYVFNNNPIANAGGPYSANEGTPVALDGSASTDPGGAITAYAWDLDGDGQFDDATGATPSATFPSAFVGFIGLRVLDADGNAGIDYAQVTVADVNGPPSIDAFTPAAAQQQVLVGSSLAFALSATDPDADSVSINWLVDFSPAGTGAGFTYSPDASALGMRVLRAEVTDGNVGGGTVAREWAVSVLMPDADGDGWRANVDCNDANSAIYPGQPEVIGNGLDDDCDPGTLDGGNPPVAAFSSAPAPGLVNQLIYFTDASSDPDSPIVSWAWDFGDGGVSTVQDPSHTYATAGTFTVRLTVTDPQGHSAFTETQVTSTNAPTAAFTFSPSQAFRTKPVQFTDLSSDLDGPIASWAWQFGDGGTSTVQSPVHSFAAAGSYTVSLMVTDGDGATASATDQIVVAPSVDDLTSVQFVLGESNCGSGVVYGFTIGGVQVATLTPTYDCTCGPGSKTVTVTDPAVLDLITSPVCQVFGLSVSTNSHVGWAYVDIIRVGSVQRIRIVNNNPADGPDTYSNYVCNAGYYLGARTFLSALPNLDGDGTPDCTDDDVDGDSVLNGADNCLLVANPNQADFNGDGFGDACQDSDADGVKDSVDNCQTVANANQSNLDHDAFGDVCDDDIDSDGHLNAADNCPYMVNATQLDTDSDGHGDVCDVAQVKILIKETSCNSYWSQNNVYTFKVNGTPFASLDNTISPCDCNQTGTREVIVTDQSLLSVLGSTPSCNLFNVTASGYSLIGWAKIEITHWSSNVETVTFADTTGGTFDNYVCRAGWQYAPTYGNTIADTDNDGFLDCKDPDIDADTVLNGVDNCPYVANTSQADVDNNGMGDACQDTDADGVLDINDNCPTAANANQSNIDGDATGDVCDADIDNDTVLNGSDNCPVTVNPGQADLDHDGLGDVCDSDVDGDGVTNGSDNCPVDVNVDQKNTDGDGFGDVCDPDMDNDSVANAADNCPLFVNPSQTATNAYGIGDACVPTPITVPWFGAPTQPHQVFDGGALTLQGVAVYPDYSAAVNITKATWDPGDGTPAVDVSIANPLALELLHTYNGAPGNPFTAVLTVTFANGFTRSDNFQVIVQAKTIDVEANMAIDKGLWFLHKTLTRTTVGTGIPAGYWVTPHSNVAGTASTIQAFEINNHREIGSRAEDPYVEDVTRGLAWLETQLNVVGIGVQTAGDPDTNHNGIGLQANNDNSPIYVTAQVADAFVASGTPDAVAVAGNANVNGHTYREIVQDMMDMYWWGQADALWPGYQFQGWRGGWHYSWNTDADNSTAQWGAIAGLAGENAWNIPVPNFVKTENLNFWLKFSQNYGGWGSSGFYDGSFGYGGTGCVWSNCMAETPSGLVQMVFDGVRNDPSATTDPEMRFQAGLRFMARGMRAGWFKNDPTWSVINVYAMFATAKAFRLATGLDANGNVVANPVVMLNDDPSDPSKAFDWYRSDPPPGGTAPIGIARLLISAQEAGGRWNSGSYWLESLSTSYGIIILSPTIFELGPTAVCSAVPTTIAPGGTVDFDGGGSFHNDPGGSIASYSWNFQDNSALETNQAPSHSFANLGTYNVSLTVTDQNGISASTSCPVNVIAGNLPPTAAAGGPYNFCYGGPMILDATQSSDPEGGPLTFTWDLTSPLTFANPEGATGVFDATSSLASLLPGTYQIGLRVTDDQSQSNAVFPDITILPASDPACNQPPTFTPPADITTPATSSAGAIATFTATGSDTEDGPIAAVCSPASGTTFAITTTTVNCTVTDSAGETVNGSFTVTVTDNAPTFTPPADITTPATSGAGAVVSFTATGSDTEDGPIAGVCVPPSGSTFAITTTTVNCTVTDSAGATAIGSFTVTVTPQTTTTRAYGSAYFFHDLYQEKITLDVRVQSGTASGSLMYYYTRTRMNLVATQIVSMTLAGNTATITGIGTVNGAPGYTFVASVSDGPDAFGIRVNRPDGTLLYQYSKAIAGGSLTVVP